MFTPENLKKNKKDVIENILFNVGREEVISFCSEFLDKRAYFTMDNIGNIKRKDYTYIIPSAVFMENDRDFIDYISKNLDFAEKIKIEKIGRMTNATLSEITKNIYKFLFKGEYNFLLKSAKELYMRDEDLFFKIMYRYTMMDNMKSLKPLAIYSLKKYFEKYGYYDEALYLTLSYISKARADFYDYEREVENLKDTEEDYNIIKQNLIENIKNNIEKYNTKEGLEILSYLLVLSSYSYENENVFINILNRKIEEYNKKDTKTLLPTENIEKEIYNYLSKEV